MATNNRLLGFRFRPTDQELLSCFLYKKAITKDPLISSYYSNIVHEFNFLGETEPWLVWDQFGGPGLVDEDLYFFTELKNVSPKGKRIKRKIEAGGTWSEAFSKKVYDKATGNPIGQKRNLRYENQGCEHHGKWLLEEYSLLDKEAQKIVLCRLKKNSKVSSKRNNSTQEFKEKPSNKKARKELALATVKIDDEESQRSSSLSGVINNHDEELIFDINYNAISNYLCGDDQDNIDDPFDYGCITDEEYAIGMDALLGTPPLSRELPHMAETPQVEAMNSRGLENICNQQLDDITYWFNN